MWANEGYLIVLEYLTVIRFKYVKCVKFYQNLQRKQEVFEKLQLFLNTLGGKKPRFKKCRLKNITSIGEQLGLLKVY